MLSLLHLLRGGRETPPSTARTGARRSQRGNAIIEFSLMVPWIFFLFVGALDFGFYAYALISVQNAARAATLQLAAVQANYDQALADPTPLELAVACPAVRGELLKMPNFSDLPADCSARPLDVTVSAFTGPGATPGIRVTVGYDTVPLIPIPGLLTGQLRITRSAGMSVFGD